MRFNRKRERKKRETGKKKEHYEDQNKKRE